MKHSSIGSYIRTLRIGCGLTQKALADQLHVTDKAVSKWERDLSCPDIRLLPALAEALHVTISDLIIEFGNGGSPEDLVERYEESSDLRTPLHIILGCADLLETYHDDQERFARYLEAIRVSVDYLLSVLTVRDHGHPLDNPGIDALLRDSKPSCESAPPTYDFSGRRILIAEGIEINREIVSEVLRPTGTRLEFAVNGNQCVDMIDRNPSGYYDLIFLELRKPECDGIEATRRIRHMDDRDKSLIPIIAITANVTESDKQAAFEAGMNAFVEKPVLPDYLYRTMQRFL